MIKKLTNRQRQVLEAYRHSNPTQQDLANELGVTRQRVQQILKRLEELKLVKIEVERYIVTVLTEQ